MHKEDEHLAAILAEMRDVASNRDWHNHANKSNRERVENWADRIEAAVASDRRKECEQCIHDRVRDEEMKTLAEQMSPAEETDLTLFEMRRSAENGIRVIKENQQVRSALECYVDNTLAYENRLADSIARERRLAATKLSLAELHINTLHKQFKHHDGEIK